MDPQSRVLRQLLAREAPLTVGDVVEAFGEQSFAALLLVLMAAPALPLPTGGVTHVLELVAALLSVEMIAGRRGVWLPARWRARRLPPGLRRTVLPRILRMLTWAERHRRVRLPRGLDTGAGARLLGALVLVLTAFAFLAPPFSGLDTLPALGVVLIAASLLLQDAVLLVAGILAGGTGIALVLLLGRLVLRLFP